MDSADVAQLAERVLGKDEVTSSILVIGSSLRSAEREGGLRQAGLAACAVAEMGALRREVAADGTTRRRAWWAVAGREQAAPARIEAMPG